MSILLLSEQNWKNDLDLVRNYFHYFIEIASKNSFKNQESLLEPEWYE